MRGSSSLYLTYLKNIIRLLFICVLAIHVQASYAQNIEKQVVASQFGEFKVPSVGTGFSFPPASCQVTGGGKNFAAFSTNAAVKIVDTNPAHVEVVTPTAVFINSCAVSLATTFPHTDFYLTSGTGGLQEAITNGQVHGTPNTVILDQEWYSLIQPRSASTVIASVTGNTSMGIVDVTTTPYTYYQWSGSAYVVVQISGTGLPLTGGTLSGALIAPEINGEVFPASCGSSSPAGWCTGTTADAWIRAACNVFPAGTTQNPTGGFVNLHGLTGNLAATTRGCSTPTRQIVFETDPTVRLDVTETDGDITFPLDNASVMVGPGAGQCLGASGIHLTSSTNITAIIGTAHTDNSQENFAVIGQCLWGVAGATVTKGGIYSEGNFTNTTITDNNVFDMAPYGIRITNSSSITLANNWSNSSEGTTYTASPLLIESTIANGGTGCRAGGINITNGQYEHSYGGAAEITIQGDGQGAIVCGVNITHVGTERNTANGAPIGIKVSDCWDCTIDHILPSGTNGGADLINFSQTAPGRTQNGVFQNTYVGGVYTNALNNTVDSPNVVLTAASNPQITTAYIAPGYAQAGAPVGPSGGCLTGTYPNPGLLPSCVVAGVAGQPIVPSSVSSKIVNGTSNCAAYSGSTVDVKVNACISDALNLANGNTTGLADARGLSGNLVSAAEIDLGNTAGGFARLLLPCTGSWQGSMTGGTAVTLKQFGGAEPIGCPVSSDAGLFYLGATSGSNLYAIYEQSGSSSPYIHAEGFNALNSSGHATASHYTVVVDGGTFGPFCDGSDVKSVNVNDFSNPSGGGILFRNVGCGYTWENSAFNSNGGGTPITIQSDSSSYVQGLNFLNDTAVDPGTGKPAVFCSDSRSPHVSQALWTGGYTETNTTDTNTAPFQTSSGNPCQQMTFRDYLITSNVASNASPIFSGSTSTILTLDNVNLRPGRGTWTYPIAAVSGQPAVTDSAGHIDHWVTQTSPSYFGPIYPKQIGMSYFYADQFTGSDVSIKINTCASALISAGGGTCDASNLGVGSPVTQNISTQINWGDTTNSGINMRLILPANANWTATIVDSPTRVSCAINQFSPSKIEGPGVGGGGVFMRIFLGASANLHALWCTDQTHGLNNYIQAGNFQVINRTSGNNADFMADAWGLVDQSWIHDLYGENGMGNVWKIANSCCTTKFERIQGFGANATGSGYPTNSAFFANGGIPLTLGDVSTAINGITIEDSTFNAPKTGMSNIVTAGPVQGVVCLNCYMEGNGAADQTTPMFQDTTALGSIAFIGGAFNQFCPSSCSKYVFQNASTHHFSVSDAVQGNGTLINNTANSFTVAGIQNGVGNAPFLYTGLGSAYISSLTVPTINGVDGTWTGNVEVDSNLNMGSASASGQLKFFGGGHQEATLAADGSNMYITSSGNVPVTLGDAAGTYVFKISDSSAAALLTVPSSGTIVAASPIKTPISTVSGLPSASTAGAGAQVVVSDATTFTPGACTGGGSDYMIAVSNGSSWSCH